MAVGEKRLPGALKLSNTLAGPVVFREGGTCPANENKPPCVSAEELDDGYIMVDYVKKTLKCFSVIFLAVQTRVL